MEDAGRGAAPAQVPFRLWAAYGAFLAALGALLLVAAALLWDASGGARPSISAFLLLGLAAAAAATWAVLAAGGLPPRLFWGSYAAVVASGLLTGAAVALPRLEEAPCGYHASEADWQQAGLFAAMAARGAHVEPPEPGWQGPWSNASVGGIAYTAHAEEEGGFYLRHDGRLLTYAGPWSNGTSLDLADFAARLTGADPRPWEGQLRLGRAVPLPPLERLPALLAELAGRSVPVPAGAMAGHATLAAGLWRLDLSGAVASSEGLASDPFGGAHLRGLSTAEADGHAEAEARARDAASAWMAARGWPFEPRWFDAELALC